MVHGAETSFYIMLIGIQLDYYDYENDFVMKMMFQFSLIWFFEIAFGCFTFYFLLLQNLSNNVFFIKGLNLFGE